MSYNPTTWQDGDLITAEKLNKMETGIANGGGGGSTEDVVVNIEYDTGFGNVNISATKTYTELRELFNTGNSILCKVNLTEILPKDYPNSRIYSTNYTYLSDTQDNPYSNIIANFIDPMSHTYIEITWYSDPNIDPAIEIMFYAIQIDPINIDNEE